MDGDLFSALTAIHAAGAGAGTWQDAMDAILDVSGVRIVTLETSDRTTLEHTAFQGAGILPEVRAEYLGLSAKANPRAVYAVSRCVPMFTDENVFGSEEAIDGDRFYNEFLRPSGVRYVAGANVARDVKTVTFLTFCRSPCRGPITGEDVDMFGRLVPHVRQALAVSRRVRNLSDEAHSLASALEWLAEGTALLDENGHILHSNAVFEAIARANDGLNVQSGMVTLASGSARESLSRALGRVSLLAGGEPISVPADFLAERPSGLPPYVLSLRPVFRDEEDFGYVARAILFVRDPLAAAGAGSVAFAHLDLTRAEADLASALLSGLSPREYARRRRISVNTVYTHLRRLKEKVGGGHLAELIHRLNAVKIPVKVH